MVCQLAAGVLAGTGTAVYCKVYVPACGTCPPVLSRPKAIASMVCGLEKATPAKVDDEPPIQL